MIAPMKKVWLVVHEKEKSRSLLALRKLGLMHLETDRASGLEYEKLVKMREDLSVALNIVPTSKAGNTDRLSTEDALSLARKIISDNRRIDELLEESGRISRELDLLVDWGEVDPEKIAALKRDGIELRFYTTTPRGLSLVPETAQYLVLFRDRQTLRIAAIGRSTPIPAMPPEFVELAIPSESTASMKTRLGEIASEIAACRAGIAAAASGSPSMREAVEAIEQETRFVNVAQSFGKEGPVCYIKGFVPAKEYKALQDHASKQGWGVLADDPGSEDVTPTKVENNAFVRMIDPVFEFLGTVPGYREYEISSFFLLFFSLFFAMIFGDAGYGSLMLAGGLFSAIRAKKRGGAVPDGIRLLILLSSSTVVWGICTASWFSIPMEKLPEILKAISIWPVSNLNPQASKNIQVFCFIIGVIQLSIARVKNILRDFPDPKFLGQLGALSMIFGMFFFVLNLVVDAKRFPAPPFALWLVVVGFTATILFGAWNGNIFKSALEGLKNIIPNFLGAVGVFADIVSYIRLWAVGLAGASLGSIINNMGGGMLKPLTMAIFGVLLLTFGHTLNMVLSVLSVVVHGVRLNMLEFSNHLGMEWSGIKYDPFRVTYNSER